MRLTAAIQASTLSLFRILFGLVFAGECWGAIFTGWVQSVFLYTPYTFTFIGFEFLEVLHGPWMHGYYALMGALGIGIALGTRYRFFIISAAFMWTAVYLAQKCHYNNHYFLMVLVLWIMSILPADQTYTLKKYSEPFIPVWALRILQIQVAIVYFYAVIAKLNIDWLDGSTSALLLSQKAPIELLQPLFTSRWFHLFIAYMGIFYDAAIIPLLLFKRTRLLAWILSIFFHLTNLIVFHIGSFPFMALAFNVLFFNPERLAYFFNRKQEVRERISLPFEMNKMLKFGLAVYVVLQMGIPLRHFFYPGFVYWNEEGHRMSWQMMSRSKKGYAYFKVHYPKTNKSIIIHPRDVLAPHQASDVFKYPDIIWQFSQKLKALNAGEEVEIFCISQVSLNGRPSKNIVDPTVNLANVEWNHQRHSTWITTTPKR